MTRLGVAATALASVVTVVAFNGPVSAEQVGTDDIKLTSSTDARDVQVSFDPVNSRHLLVWDEDVAGVEKIRGQIVTAAGGSFAGPFDIAISGVAGGLVADEAVAWDSTRNQWVVVYVTDETTLGARDVAINTVSAAGAPGTAALVSDMGNTAGDIGFDAAQPDIAFNATSDEFLVVWRGDDESTANGEEEIFGQRLTGATLAQVGTNDFRISTLGTNGDVSIDARSPSVAWSSTANNYGVVYEQLNALTPEQIFGQSISPAGAPTAAIAVSAIAAGVEKSRPAIAANDTNGGFIAVWETYDGALTQVEAKVIGTGFVAGAALPALSSATADSGGVEIAYNPTVDRFGIVWHADADATAAIEYEIYGALVDTAGAIVEAVDRLSTMGVNGVPASIPVFPSVDRSAGGSMQTVWISDNDDVAAGTNATTAADYEVFGQQFQVNGPPTVTVEQAVGQADPTNGATVNFTATFSEAVTGFDATDVTVTGTAGGTATVTGTGPTYNIAVSSFSGSGTVSVSIAATRVTDLGGTANTASTSTDNTVTRDATAPTVTVNQQSGQADPTGTSPIKFDVVASEPLTGLGASDFSLTGTAAGLSSVLTGGPTNFVLDVSATGSGTVVASLPATSATDAVGNANAASTSTDNTVTVDLDAPTVTINQAAGQADPTNGSVQFTVVFSETVTGFDAADVTLAGAPATGATKAVTGAGPTYTVTVSGITAGGALTATVTASAATDSSGNPSAASTSTDNSVTFDSTAPTVAIVKAATQASPTNASPIEFTVTFSESVTGFTSADVDLSASTAGGTLVPTVSGSGTTYTVSVAGATSSGDVTASVVASAANDGAANASSESPAAATVAFDNVGPTVTIEQASGQADPTNVGSIDFTVSPSEPLVGLIAGDFSLAGTATGGSIASVTAVPASNDWTVSVTGITGSGTVIVTLPAAAASDAAGNTTSASTSTDNTVTVDLDAPTVTIDQDASQADPANAGPIVFTVVFSESVTGFGDDDVDLSASTTGGTAVATVTGSGSTYSVSVSAMTGDGDVVASITAGAALDSSSNASVASTSTDNTVAFDDVAPSVSIAAAVGQVSPTNASPIEFTVTFSEPVTGFTDTDVDLSTSTVGGTLAASVSGSGTTYTVSVSGMTGVGSVNASVDAGAAIDAAGNTSEAAPSAATVLFDEVAPTVTIDQASGQADPTNAGPVTFTVVFAEPVTGFGGADVDLSASTVGGTLVASVSGTGSTYTVSVSGMTGDGTVVASIASIAASDAAGNDSTASTSTDNSVRFDNVAPTATINQASSQPDPTNIHSVVFDVVFSEVVTGFGAGDVDLSASTTDGTSVVSTAGSGTTYTVTVTGMTGDGGVIASIVASAATDAAGNGNAASTSTDNEVYHDDVQPTVTIEQASGQLDPTNAGPIEFTATFSEHVTGFTDADVTLGGTAGPAMVVVTGSGSTWTLTVSGMSGHGTVTATIAAGAANDAAGNPSLAPTSTDNVVTYVPGDPNPGVNDAPELAAPSAAIAAELGVAVSMSGSNVVSVVDADAFDDDLEVTLTIATGTISAPPTSGVAITGSGTGSVTLTGVQTALNLALAGVQITPTEVGSLTVQITADDLGHTPGPALTDAATISLTVTDTVGPKIVIATPSMSVNNDPGKPGADVTYATSVSMSDLGSQPWSGQFTNAPAPSLSCTPASGSFFPIGVTTVNCTARDSVGNVSSASMTVTVLDVEKPTLVGPTTSPRVMLAPGSTSGAIAYAVPAVADNSGSATVTCTPAVGTIVPVGHVTVTCTAQDASGATYTESFIVLVFSGELPATGGTLRLLPWAALVVLAGCALVIVTQRRRRLT